MSLDSIVQITIDAQTTSPSRKGFGVPLIVGFHAVFAELTRSYTSLAAMLTDGFTAADGVYKAARAVFAQNPRPQKILVGRLTAGAVQRKQLTPVAKNAHTYSVTINGTAFTYLSDADATQAEIVAGLRTAINAGAEPVVASVRNTALEIVSTLAGAQFDLEFDYADFAFQNITTDTKRLAATSIQTKDLTPIVANATTYAVRINGVEFTYLSDGDATATEIVDGLRDAINGGAEPVTASNVADVLHLVSDDAGVPFEVEYLDAQFSAFADNTVAEDVIATQLAAISLEDDSWYALVMDSEGKAEIVAAAAYIETVKKVFLAQTADSDVLGAGAGDIASTLKAAAYARTALIFCRNPHQFANAAWGGEELPNDPGSSTWAFKTLAGVTVDTFTETEQSRLKSKRCNFYQEVAGVNVTMDGITPAGEYVDVTIFVDWLQARMQERIFGILANIKKLPFTDAGIQLVKGAILAQLREGVNAGGLVDDDVLQVLTPAAADVSAADKAARSLTGVTFQGTLAGAIHELVIQGTVTV